MNEPFNPQKMEAKVRGALSAPDPDPQFVERLERRLLVAAPGPAARARRPSRGLRPAWAAALAVLVLLVVFFAVGPQRVLAAVRGLLGYVPGIGFVQTESELRVLAQPARQQRDGLSLMVEQVVVDAARTVVIYTVEGLGPQHRPGAEDAPRCLESPRLRLLDGSELSQTGGESTGWPSGYRQRLVFPPLPAGGYALVLVVPCLDDTRPGAAPESWALPLALQPAPPGFQPLPVIELAASPAAPTQAAEISAPVSQPAPASNPHGMALSVERLVPMDDGGYLLQGSFDWSQSAIDVPFFDSYSLQVYDANGQRVPAEPEESGQPVFDPALEKRLPWTLRTAPGSYPGPLAVTMPLIIIEQPVEASFEFDLGPDPRPGTTWELDRTLVVAGRQIKVLSVRLAGPAADGNHALAFTFEINPDELQSFSIWDPDNRSAALSGRGGGSGSGDFQQSINYDYLPAGVRRMLINHISYYLHGPWSAAVELPVVAHAGESTVSPPAPAAACLTPEQVEQLKAAQPAAIPPELGGRVLAEGPVVTGANFSLAALYAANLDGAQKIDIGPGGWADLSPDGRRVVYSDADGSYIVELDGGRKTRLVWPPENAYQFLWSPDGERLAFANSGEVINGAGIYVARLDGSEMQKVPNTSVSTFLAGWLPDGKGLIVTELGAEGSLLKTVDVQTGAAVEHFIIDQRKGGFVLPSPDGRWVAFSEMVFGQPGYGLFVANLDGSGKRLVASLGLMAASARGWSPDGRWLLVSASEAGPVKDTNTNYLVQPDTCQVIPLLGIPDRVASWR